MEGGDDEVSSPGGRPPSPSSVQYANELQRLRLDLPEGVQLQRHQQEHEKLIQNQDEGEVAGYEGFLVEEINPELLMEKLTIPARFLDKEVEQKRPSQKKEPTPTVSTLRGRVSEGQPKQQKEKEKGDLQKLPVADPERQEGVTFVGAQQPRTIIVGVGGTADVKKIRVGVERRDNSRLEEVKKKLTQALVEDKGGKGRRGRPKGSVSIGKEKANPGVSSDQAPSQVMGEERQKRKRGRPKVKDSITIEKEETKSSPGVSSDQVQPSQVIGEERQKRKRGRPKDIVSIEVEKEETKAPPGVSLDQSPSQVMGEDEERQQPKRGRAKDIVSIEKEETKASPGVSSDQLPSQVKGGATQQPNLGIPKDIVSIDNEETKSSAGVSLDQSPSQVMGEERAQPCLGGPKDSVSTEVEKEETKAPPGVSSDQSPSQVVGDERQPKRGRPKDSVSVENEDTKTSAEANSDQLPSQVVGEERQKRKRGRPKGSITIEKQETEASPGVSSDQSTSHIILEERQKPFYFHYRSRATPKDTVN